MFSFFFLIVTISFVALLWYYSAKHERFISALDIPNKCFDCEKQFPAGYEWMGQKTKCFDCQSQLFAMSQGLPYNVFDTQPIRYYTQPKLGYMG